MKKVAIIYLLIVSLFCTLGAKAYAATVNVSIGDNFFSPQTVTVNVGDTIKWTNNGIAPHTATSGTNCPTGDGKWDSLTLSTGQSFPFTFTQAGTFPYFCSIHCFTGTVVVNPVTVPRPIAPSGTITDTTPTYKWTKITGATKYRFQLREGLTTVYTVTAPSSVCGTTTCKKTPTTVLGFASYKWRVGAMLNGVWKTYSAFKSFSVAQPLSPGPKADFWESTGEEFYVTTDQKNVDNVATYINVTGCGKYKLTHTSLVPIVGNNFSFSGAFYASGTFDSATSSHGTNGLDHFYISGCGTVSGGPWSWTTTWKSTSQPVAVSLEENTSAITEEDPSVTVEEILDSYHTIEKDPDNQ